ncbi:ISAzo13 family transposase [Candidatus Mycobacterium methanotrophicum]|uniref:ISAzo13 family transposase n=2 Tax=Candidatus Mycobacterium methanotrophicum TaxID=2943498 RepID=A0ABY4QTP3_9MYCO|nr:ISAzo13 family transposase [Candidatus Mycobacterium methanotrophicum]
MAVTAPDLLAALDALVDPVSRGDPESPLRWTTKSAAKLAAELSGVRHRVSARTVAKLLKAAGYSLQANSKTLEGDRHRDRDAQFCYLNTRVERFPAGGDPVISVDIKKKELAANYEAAGREREPAGSPRTVHVHDFADKALGKAAPYGVYGIAASTGWVNAGADAATGAFAVESIRRWWITMGAIGYPGSGKLLITADSGGSNGSRLRLWKIITARPKCSSRPAAGEAPSTPSTSTPGPRTYLPTGPGTGVEHPVAQHRRLPIQRLNHHPPAPATRTQQEGARHRAGPRS